MHRHAVLIYIVISESEIRGRSIALYRSTVAEFESLVNAMKTYLWPDEPRQFGCRG